MTAPTPPLVAIYNGLRTRLASATAGWTIVMGPADVQDPDQLITLHPYPVSDSQHQDDPGSIAACQIRIRGTKDAGRVPVDTIQQAIFDRLHLAERLTLDGVLVHLTWRQMSANLGLDGRGRPEVTDTYFLHGFTAA